MIFTFVWWTKKKQENNSVLAGRSLLLSFQYSHGRFDPFPPFLRPATQATPPKTLIPKFNFSLVNFCKYKSVYLHYILKINISCLPHIYMFYYRQKSSFCNLCHYCTLRDLLMLILLTIGELFFACFFHVVKFREFTYTFFFCLRQFNIPSKYNLKHS